MNLDTVAHLTRSLSKEMQTSSEEFHNKGSVNPYRINQKYSVPNISSPQQQQPTIIDWYFIYPYATYYLNTSIGRELNSSKENIVINDNSSSTNLPKSILKSKTEKKLTKKRISFSPHPIIGSQTMKDLSQVINNQRSRPAQSTSMIDRVIIIDRYNSNSTDNNQPKVTKNPIHTTAPITTPTVSMTPYMTQQPPYYYNPQPSTIYTFIPNNIYLAVANAISFLYYSY